MEPTDAVNPVPATQGIGVKIGERTELYPQVGLETGYVSNVFYTNDNPVGSALLRVIVAMGVGSMAPQRLEPTSSGEASSAAMEQGPIQFNANAYATWDQYISDNSAANAQGGLGGGVLLRALINPQKPFTVWLLNDFNRVLRATNFESNHDTNQDINTFLARATLQPPGSSFGGYAYYTGMLDLFEQDSQQFADRLDNTLGVRVMYRLFPLTQLYLDVSEGYFTGVGSSSEKVTSFPLTAVLGLNTFLTVRTLLVARIGYGKGFYQSGPDYGTVLGGAMLQYVYSPTGKLTGMYDYTHQDSINANFYRDHSFQLWLEQQKLPFLLYAAPQLRLREYDGVIVMGPPVRDDVILAVWAGVRYSLRDWLVGTLEYRLTDDQTDYRYLSAGVTVNPSFVRHEILLGLRAAY
ncbi:MAG TPA: hypothetical protein VMJ10_30770 [Kofleriaceae bacterium]|nr:hypothetical protein [Kofleriaceae bacterium]